MAGRGTDGQAGDVAAAAGELYGLPLGEFTAARAERAKQARSAGDRGAAAVIAKLPKPNVVAWLANQLARQHPGEIRPLLELGESLRQATAALDAPRLGQLSRQQRQVVSALMGRARELAAEAGHAVSDGTARGLEETLHAALADEHAARELAQGQLAAGLSRTGFPGIDAAAGAWAGAGAGDTAATALARERVPPAEPGPPGQAAGSAARAAKAGSAQRAAKAASERRAEAARAAAEARRQQLERARRTEADARGDAAEAGREQDRARAALVEAEGAARQAEETISRLQAELDAALDARNSAGPAQRQARREADRADRTARQAERRLTEATARREDLERDA
jgi:hypothetical protein